MWPAVAYQEWLPVSEAYETGLGASVRMDEFGSYSPHSTYFSRYHREPSSGPERGDTSPSPPLKDAEPLPREPDRRPGVIPHQGPRHPRFATVLARRTSFDEWPPALKQTPEAMADAGFIYLGLSDQVKCFYCDGGLRDWAEGDDPWVEHAGWLGEQCGFVRLLKGDQFVADCKALVTATVEERRQRMRGEQEAAAAAPAPASPREQLSRSIRLEEETGQSALQRENARLREQRRCKVCMDADVGVVFLPCGHLVVCVNCAPSLKNCVVCRTEINGNVRTFLS